MSLLGIHLTLLIGPTVPIPAPPPLMEALESVQVSHGDSGRSGFQITFQAGRSGPLGLVDDPLLLNPLLMLFNRVILIVTFGGIPNVLMDGIITNRQLSPGDQAGSSTLTVTGEDVSVMMDREEKPVEHAALAEPLIVYKILANYAQYMLIPIVIPPMFLDPPIPIKRTPVQRTTDLGYLKQMADRHGYVFFITPGPAPGSNTAYWGPPQRVGLPQRALSVNLGAETNVDSIGFQHNALAPVLIAGDVQDAEMNVKLPVQTFVSTRPPLALLPDTITNMANLRKKPPEAMNGGVSFAQAMARAQAETDKSVDDVVTATGTLDSLRYGGLLRPRSIVGVRGVGFTYGGNYYVKSVSHSIKRGQYKQSFSLSREGVGPLAPVVIP